MCAQHLEGFSDHDLAECFTRLPYPIFAISRSGEIVFCNEACRTLIIPGSQGFPDIETLIPSEEAREKLLDICFEETPNSFECALTSREGESRCMIWQAGITSGKRTCAWIIGDDVSHSKNLETELNETIRVSQRSSERKTLFLSSVSREIERPLCQLQHSLEELAAKQSPEQNISLKTALEAAEEIQRLNNNLLDFLRLDFTSVLPNPNHFRVQDLLEDLSRDFKTKAEARGLTLSVAAGEGLDSVITADQEILRHILENILYTFFRGTHSGETITISAAGLTRVEDFFEVMFSIANSEGRSTERDVLEVFDPSSSALPKGGRNLAESLGLYVSSQLIRKLGGNLALQSALEGGTVFTFSLPCRTVPKESVVDAKVTDTPRHFRILLAEDNPTTERYFELVLSRVGHLVEIAKNGDEAVEKFRGGNYDLVVMDLQTDDAGGIEIAKAIRSIERPSSKRVPIVGVTSRAFTESEIHFEDTEMDAMIAKPVRIWDLTKTVERFVKKSTG
jgi:signal transduction histidine kinase/ActR/RegA family two-component response regulator